MTQQAELRKRVLDAADHASPELLDLALHPHPPRTGHAGAPGCGAPPQTENKQENTETTESHEREERFRLTRTRSMACASFQ